MENIDKKALAKAYKEKRALGGVYVYKNTADGKMQLGSSANLHGAKGRFDFNRKRGAFEELGFQADTCGDGESLVFEVLEELECKEGQTLMEFKKEIALLEELWRERLAGRE